MHPGGIADKVGNRYEAVWLIRHLVQLIDGRAQAIRIELLGDVGAGFEFCVDRPTHREWHQCKRQTSSAWTINRLASEGILANFKTKLENSASDICVFVSTDPAKSLKLLKEKLPAAADTDQFEAALSGTEQTDWQNLQQQLELDARSSLDWLARSDFMTYPESELRLSLSAELERWFASPPEAVIDALRSWIEDDGNFNRPIVWTELESYLGDRGIALKQYEFDQTIPGKLRAANLNYDASYRPVGSGLFDIDRVEVDALVDALKDPEGLRTIALAGPAGWGKSVVIRKALARLAGGQTPILVFRVDQLAAISSLSGLGETTIEINDSPAVVLEQLAGHQAAILIIDQADAVSEMSGRASLVRTVLLKLLRQARYYPRLKVVFSCRSFDLDNDHEFRAVADPKFCRLIDMTPLRWTEDVLPIAKSLGIGVEQARIKIQALLCQPIGLAIAAELARSGPVNLAHVEHISQLYDELFKLRDLEFRKYQLAWSLYDAMGAVAKNMSDREQLAAPVAVLDRYPGAIDLLQQAGLVVVQGRKLALMHESLFDYLHARSFVTDGKRLSEFLLESEQTLFRRTQVRQILAQERDLDRAVYLADLGFILSGDGVRPHVRELVLRWLATLPDPGFDEWQLVLAHAQSQTELPRHTGRVIFGNKGWLLLLDQHGILDTWFGAADDDDLYWALRAVETIAKTAQSDAVKILSRFLDRRPEKVLLVLRCFSWFQPDHPMPAIADMVIRCMAMCNAEALGPAEEGPFSLADGWVKHARDDAGRILAAVLASWYRQNEAGTPFGDAAHHLHRDFYHFNELAEADPIAALAGVIPAMRVAMDRTEGSGEQPVEDSTWYWRRKDHGSGPHLVEFIDMVRSALQRVAREYPDRIAGLLAPLDPRRHMTALHLLLEAISASPELAPLLEEQIENPGLFKAGWHHANAFSAGKAMATCWPRLKSGIREQLEARLMRLYPELEFAARCYSRSKDPQEEGDWSPEQRRTWAKHGLAESGKTQWSTFRQLAGVKLSAQAQRRASELERKFLGQQPEEPDGIRSGSSRSPIPADKAKRMNDTAWLSAISTDWSQRRHGRDGGFGGEAHDLARVLHEEAKADSARFLKLYWQLPVDVSAVFARAILSAVAETTLAPQVLDDLLLRLKRESPWQPDHDTLLSLISQRPGEALGPTAVATIRTIAFTGDPGKAEVAAKKEKEKPEPLFRTAMNQGHELAWRGRQTARGQAIDRLGRMAWHDSEVFAGHKDLVDQAMAEEGPDRLLAATTMFVQAAIKHEPAQALRWLRRLVKLAPEALAHEDGRTALLRLDQLDHEQTKPLLLELLHGSDSAISALAAALIMVRSFDGTVWSAERNLILAGNVEWRAAAAHVSAHQLERDVRDADLNTLIISFFNDGDELVRTAAADAFRLLDTSAMALHADLYRGYLGSLHFEGERTYFLHRLEDAPAELDSLVLELIELAASKIKTVKAGRGTIGYRLGEPLMRVYLSSDGNAPIRRRCLDVVDILLLADIGGSDKLQEATR